MDKLDKLIRFKGKYMVINNPNSRAPQVIILKRLPTRWVVVGQEEAGTICAHHVDWVFKFPHMPLIDIHKSIDDNGGFYIECESFGAATAAAYKIINETKRRIHYTIPS